MGRTGGAGPAVALATTIAAALRLPFLDDRGLRFDETYTVAILQAGGPGDLWSQLGATESTPPLFYALAWALSAIVGDQGEATIRAVPALALIASVPVAYAALRRLVGDRAAVAAAWIVAVSPLLVRYSLEGRSYGLLVLLGLCSIWAFAALLDRPSLRRWALWTLAAAAAIWTHYFSGFLVLGEAIGLLVLRPRLRTAALASMAAVALAVAPLAPLVLEQTGDARAGFIGDLRLVDRVEQLVRQFALGPNVPRAWLEAVGLAVAGAAVAAGALLLARASPRASSAHEDRIPDGPRALLGLVAIVLLPPLLLDLTGIYDRFYARNVLFLVPPIAGVAAVALIRLRGVALAVYLAVALAATAWIHSDWRYQEADWRVAVEDRGVAASAVPVVAVAPLDERVATRYLGREPATAPLTTRRALLIVEPGRTPGRRELAPVATEHEQSLGRLFPRHRERHRRGFRLIELTAPAPVPIDPGVLPGATVFPR